jgi:hypothetical protein
VTAYVNNLVAHAEQEGMNRFQIRIFAANPEDKFSLRGGFRRSGHRRINKMNLPRCRCGGHLLRERRIDRTAIDPERIWPKIIQKPIRT